MSESTQPDPAIVREINALTHFELCRLWRFAPSNHPWFDSSGPYAEIFKERLFGHFKGFTPEISKSLGFGPVHP